VPPTVGSKDNAPAHDVVPVGIFTAKVSDFSRPRRGEVKVADNKAAMDKHEWIGCDEQRGALLAELGSGLGDGFGPQGPLMEVG
jgi:hypothetical protein